MLDLSILVDIKLLIWRQSDILVFKLILIYYILLLINILEQKKHIIVW